MRFILCLSAAACISSLSPRGLPAQERTDSATPARAERPRGRAANVLIEEEIARAAATDAYEVVYRLRPNWLRRRGPTTLRSPGSGEVTVYVDGVQFGDNAVLRSIPAGDVVGMAYFSAADATTRFGGRQGGAVIEVYTRRQ
jgi:hypothetical protein